MRSAIQWLPDGSAYSPKYGDRYHAAAGHPLAQARGVFLAGCGLPEAWREARQWRVLENGFGLGFNFLATWDAWRRDPDAPRLLHYVGIEAHPLLAADLQALYERLVSIEPGLVPLCEELLAHWWGLTPGMHRIILAEGRLHLTLVIGEAAPALSELAGEYDSLYLDGFAPDCNPAMWSRSVLRALARRAAPGARAASWCVAGEVRRHLTEAGFLIERLAGLPPKRHRLSARYAPAWTVRRRPGDATSLPRGMSLEGLEVAVIGAGLAGAAAADALTRRGARVTVVDRAEAPAAGASSLPAGLMAAHFSRDDGLMTQLTRAGIRLTIARARSLLREGEDFALTGCEQHLDEHGLVAPSQDEHRGDWLASLAVQGRALHRPAGWIKPARLVAALLQAARARLLYGYEVARITPDPTGLRYQLLDHQGQYLLAADRVVVAAGPASEALLPRRLGLRPVAGQVAWAEWHESGHPVRQQPQNGFGHWLPWIENGQTPFWLLGSTYEPGLEVYPEPFTAMLEAASSHDPGIAAAIELAIRTGQLRRWHGVRATTPDRLPRVGVLAGKASERADVGYLTGLGSRGLSLALLCAEHLAALLADEPPPIPHSVMLRWAAGLRDLHTRDNQPGVASLP